MESPLPLSPRVSLIQLKDCIEELLKFTLISSVQGKLQTGLSNEYCANLLRDDPSSPLSTNCEASKGVPSYPLYKRLASSLYHSIHSGVLSTSYKEPIKSNEDQSLKKKDDELNELFLEKGSVLQSILRKVDFELHVQEPFFSQLSDGLKTIEGRCAVGNYKRIQSGHLLLFNKCMILEVQDVRKYASFHEMLEAETLAKVLPGVESIEEELTEGIKQSSTLPLVIPETRPQLTFGVQIYRNFYPEEKERSNGVLAICLKIPASQLYVMASILSGLSYVGVQRLLGFVETVGTNQELLPPPTSTLMSAFLAPHNPDVKSSTLTNGARALAKHVNRSSERYWGDLNGSDFDKNRCAMGVITRLLTNCSWLNMHIVPPHGFVFEIRSDGGYGARWSADGSKLCAVYRISGAIHGGWALKALKNLGIRTESL